MSLKLCIPSAEIADTEAKPYTVYNIVVRLPLREITIQKRYSQFLDFHSRLSASAGSPPPLKPPPKSFWSRTIYSPSLTEDRRASLEKYLLAILESPDPKWRNSAEFRQFLNLPASWYPSASSNASSSVGGGNKSGGIATIATTGQPITDPHLWLDVHRELKSLLHDARLNLSKRDQAATPTEQHEFAAAARKCLVKAGGVIKALEEGLRIISEPPHQSTLPDIKAGNGTVKVTTGSWGKAFGSGISEHLGEGEIRRRKDLIASARKERDALDSLANSLSTKRAPAITGNAAQASTADKVALFGDNNNHHSRSTAGRRVLGGPLPETERTRELDNAGVLQLQKQFLKEQDEEAGSLLKTVMRQKELGHMIRQELEEQNKLLEEVDQDVTSLEGKIKIGNRRINKIS